MAENLTKLLGIRHPILLAGMAGGPTTPELVGAVSRGGGLGVLGVNSMTVDAARAAVRASRELAGGGPVGANVLLAEATDPTTDDDALADSLSGVRGCFGLPPRPGAPGTVDQRELVQAVLDEGIAALSIGMGDPTPVAAMAKKAGVPIIAMVTTVEEAVRVVAAGADVVVAQGWEAGGHRSTFIPGPRDELPQIGTFALVPQVAAAVDVPVVAAGGVMDGGGIAAALCLGAEGVQMGTRFLGTAQSGVSEAYRERLRAAGAADTRIIRHVSGRPARGVPNTIVAQLEDGPGHLGWPRQAAAWRDIRTAATKRDDMEFVPLWAGQNAQAVAAVADDAQALVGRLMDDARAVLARVARSI
ncbi:MAG: nitronate monooxygenase [Thermoleophilia bacterium]|nr:nitronate monooxygenase [Thermoleophilia bacterium]